jgi:hypothetical protein
VKSSGTPPALPPHVSDTHRRALSVRFHEAARNCEEMQRLLDGLGDIHEEPTTGALPEHAKARIQGVLSHLLLGLAQVESELALPKKQVSLQRSLAANVSNMWETLCESKARYLHGYGEVPEDLRAYLDFHVDELLAVVEELRALVEAIQREA